MLDCQVETTLSRVFSKLLYTNPQGFIQLHKAIQSCARMFYVNIRVISIQIVFGLVCGHLLWHFYLVDNP